MLEAMTPSNTAKLIIILTESYGNHSNRLFQAIHFEAYCIEHGHKFYNATFLDMGHLYPNIKTGWLSAAISVLARLLNRRVLNRIARVVGARQDPHIVSDIERATKFPIVFVGGWNFRVHDLTEKFQNYFIEKYSIDKNLLLDIQLVAQIARWKLDNNIVIGLHIRRGDYKTWQNGRYFYPDAVYERYVNLLSDLITAAGGRAKIVVFSNEATSIEERLDCELSKNEWYIDHFLMSQCDFLIGPPSTFTLWASYIGKTRYYHIENPSSAISLSDFRYCCG